VNETDKGTFPVVGFSVKLAVGVALWTVIYPGLVVRELPPSFVAVNDTV
jgi:hypothetical protein